jgi:hypothetical protein
MQRTILALFLCTGTMAFCQPAAPAAVSPEELGRIQTAFTQPVWEINKLPASWQFTHSAPPTILTWHSADVAHAPNDAQIDPNMIVHPPPQHLGVQPPGTLVARNLYPKLQILPIQWPCLKIHPIPTVWPNLNLGMVSKRPSGKTDPSGAPVSPAQVVR